MKDSLDSEHVFFSTENGKIKGARPSSTNLPKKFSDVNPRALARALELERQVSPEVFGDWNYDILAVKGPDEFALVFKLFAPHLDAFSIPRERFFALLNGLKYSYNKNGNSFHNFTHGISVAFSANYFLSRLPVLNSKLEKHLQFAFILASLAHDVGHTGKNNNYEINSRSKLALRYNDRSPLEQHHLAKLFSLVFKHQINIFEGFSPENFNEMRHTIIECVLATDMKVHFSLLSKFEALNQDKPSPGDAFKESKELLLCMLIHAADISGSAREIATAAKWSALVAEEFTNQYQLELEKKLPVTSYFKDLHIPVNFYKSELGFLNFIVKPLYQSLKVFDFDFGEVGNWDATKKTSLVLCSREAENGPEERNEASGSARNPFFEIMGEIDKNITYYERLLEETNLDAGKTPKTKAG